jgi:16S rRNA (cytosine1402-N4)-methyltransferase
MVAEVLELLAVRPGGRYVDGTLGGGGHAAAILARAGADGALLGIDRDPAALGRAAARLSGVAGRQILAYGNHGEVARLAREHGFGSVDGILLDLGVSSDQIDTPDRGFSFQADGPLDMRMDPTGCVTAADLVATLDVSGLAGLFRRVGEEPQALRVAKAIARARNTGPIETTGRLSEIVSAALGGRRGNGKHPATRVFQALRMAVNRELEELEQALEDGLRLLAPDGRMVVITFESLTDRLAKQRFAAHAGRQVSLQQGGARWEGDLPAVELLTRRPRTADDDEVSRNPRARSAKVRAVRRLRPEEEANVQGGDKRVLNQADARKEEAQP